jgi:hypothetical protein
LILILILRSLSQNGVCLVNTETSKFYKEFEGLYLTANDQCKMIYGENALFCQNSNKDLCSTLSCRLPELNYTCQEIPGKGAAENTICDSGKTCVKGSCELALTAPIDSCPFGDDIIIAQELPAYLISNGFSLPTEQMTCDSALNFFYNLSIEFCSDLYFKKLCCSTCKSRFIIFLKLSNF